MNRRLIGWAMRAHGRIARLVLPSLGVTVTYAGQGLALAAVVRDVIAGTELAAILPAVGAVVGLQGARASS